MQTVLLAVVDKPFCFLPVVLLFSVDINISVFQGCDAYRHPSAVGDVQRVGALPHTVPSLVHACVRLVVRDVVALLRESEKERIISSVKQRFRTEHAKVHAVAVFLYSDRDGEHRLRCSATRRVLQVVDVALSVI